MKIVTNHVFPPIPIRSFDWVAHYDDPEGPTGSGKTEIEAINDLVANHPRANVDCPDCDGNGGIFGIECANCDGSGIQPVGFEPAKILRCGSESAWRNCRFHGAEENKTDDGCECKAPLSMYFECPYMATFKPKTITTCVHEAMTGERCKGKCLNPRDCAGVPAGARES